MNTEEKYLKNLEDDIMDRYNEGKVSKKEMINILKWCEKIQNQLFTQTVKKSNSGI